MQRNSRQGDLIPFPVKPKGPPFQFKDITMIRWTRQEKILLRQLFAPGELEEAGRKNLSTRIKAKLFKGIQPKGGRQ